MMRHTAAILVLLVGMAGTSAAQEHRLELIVPGRSIGDARLGMTEAEIRVVNARSVCQVSGRYRNGRAIVLITDWGGMCQTRGGVQVALSFADALREFGPPHSVVHDAVVGDTDAVWVSYPRDGIAFRVLVILPDRAMMIQAIAIFTPGTGSWRR